MPGLQLEQYMLSHASSNFRMMREQRTLALAWALQAHIKESSCPTGVHCEGARELQQCMALLLALNGDVMVEVSLLQSVEGEHRTSPMSEEEATLLCDIKPDIQSDIKLDIEAPQFLELLEICKQAQPAEWTITPTTSPPSSPSPPSPLPSPKAKKPQNRTTRADAIGATQWVHSYLEDNNRVPEWWREFWSLLQHPCDPAIEKLAHQQVMAFWIPATQVEKKGWWSTPPFLEVLG